METIIEEKDKVAVVTLKGRFETIEYAEAQAKVSSLYEMDLKRVVIDCKDLEYIASSGLRMMYLLIKNMKPKKTEVVIRNASEMLKDVFDSTGFSSLFKFE
jgi:anti-anti-sigma factor